LCGDRLYVVEEEEEEEEKSIRWKQRERRGVSSRRQQEQDGSGRLIRRNGWRARASRLSASCLMIPSPPFEIL